MKTSTKDRLKQYTLSFGHFCADMNQGVLSALLPFIIAAYSFDYTTAAYLVMISNLIGSVIQPIFGHIADKIHTPNLMILGIFLAGGGMCVTGIIPNFPGLCVAVVISGIGVAMFHPQGAQFVNRNSTDKNIATNLGIFSFGGNAGFSLGPIIASGAIALMGLKGTLLVFIPAILFGIFTRLAFGSGHEMSGAARDGDAHEVENACKGDAPDDVHGTESNHTRDELNGDEVGNAHEDENSNKVGYVNDQWGAFVKLCILISFRSIIFSGVNTFLILYFTDVLGSTKAFGSAMLSMYFAVASFSSLGGGRIADRLGSKKTVILSMAILLPALSLFAMTENLALSIILLVPMGIGINICYSPNVLLGQQYLPNRVGLASGVSLGLSVSIGGVFAPALGKLGDSYGLGATFWILAGLAGISLIFALILSQPRKVQG